MGRFGNAVKVIGFLSALFLFGSLAVSAEAINVSQNWSPENNIHRSDTHLSVSPDVIKLSDGRMFLTFLMDGVDNIPHLAYKFYQNGKWDDSPTYMKGTTALNAEDPTATQLPPTPTQVLNGQMGDILVAYSVYSWSGNYIDVYISRFDFQTGWSVPQLLIQHSGASNAFVPSIITLKNGSLLMAFSWGKEACYSDIYAMRSTDNGHTWSRPSLVYANPDSNMYDSRARLIQLDNGDILCSFYSSPPFCNYAIPANGDIYVVRSSDGGNTWQNRVAIYESGASNKWVSLLQLGDGELLAAFTTNEDGFNRVKLMKSPDRGATWINKEIVATGKYATWPALAQRSDRTIMVIMDNAGWEHSRYSPDPDPSNPSLTQGPFFLYESDILSPTVSITSPAIMSKVSGLLNLQVSTTGATRVEYYLDSSLTPFDVSSTPPFSRSLDTTTLPEGVHMLQAVAYDASGNRGDSIISFTVDNAQDVNYYFTWYDMRTFSNDWILISNPNATSASYEIYIGESFIGSGAIQPHSDITPQYSNLMSGPVKVVSSSGLPLIVSQRTLYNGNFNELMAVKEKVDSTDTDDLDSHYYWTWYDQQSTGAKDWVLVANPSSAAESVHAVVSFINQADGKLVTAESDIAPGSSWTPTFPGKMGGPVEVKAYRTGGSWQNTADRRRVIASQRIIWGSSFNEVMGIPASKLSNDYYWTWYDGISMKNWVLVANPSTSETVHAVVSFPNQADGRLVSLESDIAPGSSWTPTFDGKMGGGLLKPRLGSKILRPLRML